MDIIAGDIWLGVGLLVVATEGGWLLRLVSGFCLNFQLHNTNPLFIVLNHLFCIPPADPRLIKIFRPKCEAEKVFSLTNMVQLDILETLGIMIFRTEKLISSKDQGQVSRGYRIIICRGSI